VQKNPQGAGDKSRAAALYWRGEGENLAGEKRKPRRAIVGLGINCIRGTTDDQRKQFIGATERTTPRYRIGRNTDIQKFN